MGSTYYVAARGNDSSDGLTTGTAWQSITKVNAHTFVPGDTILFNGGETFAGGITISTSGISGSPISFGSYGNGFATIISPASVHGVYVHNCGYIVVQDLNFIGPSLTTLSGHGIYCLVDQSATTYNYLRINNLTVTGYTTGIFLYGNSAWHTTPQNGWNDVQITNCLVHDNSNNGINISDFTAKGAYSNIYVGYCTVYNHPGVTGQTGWSGSGIQLGVVSTGTVEYCTSYNNGTNMSALSGAVGIWTASSNAVVIQYCESYNNTSSAGDGDGFDIDGECTNCIIQYCYSHGNKAGGYLFAQYTLANTWSGNVIRYNISENDGFGIGFYGETATYLITNGLVYNNTIYSNRGPSILYEAGDDGSFHGSGLVIDNNIFVSSNQNFTQTAGGSSGTTFSHNDYYAIAGSANWNWFGSNFTTLSTWGQDSHGITSNPMLANPGGGGTVSPSPLSTLAAYQLLSGSPMIGAGIQISNPGLRDFYGNTLYYKNQFDIGANEFTPTVSNLYSNYKSVEHQSVLYSVARRMGLDPKVTLTTPVAEAYLTYIDERCREAWEKFDWTDLVIYEQRAFEDPWQAIVTYNQGQSVFDWSSMLYWTSLVNGNFNNPPATSPTFWGAATMFAPFIIPTNQVTYDEIGTLYDVLSVDPRQFTNPNHVGWERIQQGIVLYPDRVYSDSTPYGPLLVQGSPIPGQIVGFNGQFPTTVYLVYRLPYPGFATSYYMDSNSYDVGDLVYFGTDTYKSLIVQNNQSPSVSPNTWQFIAFPYVLSEFVKKAAFVDALIDDGQHEKGGLEEPKAYVCLDREYDKQILQQGQQSFYTASGV